MIITDRISLLSSNLEHILAHSFFPHKQHGMDDTTCCLLSSLTNIQCALTITYLGNKTVITNNHVCFLRILLFVQLSVGTAFLISTLTLGCYCTINKHDNTKVHFSLVLFQSRKVPRASKMIQTRTSARDGETIYRFRSVYLCTLWTCSKGGCVCWCLQHTCVRVQPNSSFHTHSSQLHSHRIATARLKIACQYLAQCWS